MKFLLFIVLLAVLRTSLGSFRSSATTPFIYDEYGRIRIFHGTNLVQKGFPWYPETLLDYDNILKLKKWGFNTIRLGVMWTGVNPDKGKTK